MNGGKLTENGDEIDGWKEETVNSWMDDKSRMKPKWKPQGNVTELILRWQLYAINTYKIMKNHETLTLSVYFRRRHH